jgi:hypothetical protein
MKQEIDWDLFVGFGDSIGMEEITGVGEGIRRDEYEGFDLRPDI